MKKSASGFFLAGLLACCLGAAWPVQAAEELFTGSEEDLLFADIASVYSASKHEQKRTEAPAKVSIVTAREIERYGYKTIADILNSQPGFYTSYDRNYSYIGVRGFGIPGDYNSRMLFLVDGHRLNDDIYGSVGTDRSFILDIDLIERIEIVRGPSSSLYGSNAFFAIINIITKRGRDLNGIEFSAGAGSHDSQQGRISYGTRLTNEMEILLSGTYYDSDGTERLYYSEFDSPTTNNGFAENADDEKAINFFATISYGDFRLDGAYADREKGIPTAPWETEFNTSRTRTWDTTYYLDLNYKHLFEDSDTEVVWRLFYDKYGYDGHYIFDYGPPPDIVKNIDFDDGRSWGTELQFSYYLGDSHHIIFGGEYSDSIRQHQKNYDIYGIWLDSNVDVDTWGLYIQDEWHVSKKWALNLGLRHDYYESSGDTTNPRAALIFSPIDATSLKFLYGKAFRAPSNYELYYHDGYPNTWATTKPPIYLEPETIQSFEFVLEQTISPNLLGSASIFHNKIENLIVYSIDQSDGFFVFTNKDEVTANGLELSLEGKWENGLATSFSYTYQDAEDNISGEWLVNSPQHLLKANFIAPIFGETLFYGMEMRYESERKTIADARTGDFFYATAKLISKNLVEGLTLDLTVYNLFDEDYSNPASEEHTQDMIRQDGLTFWFNVSFLL